MAAARITLHPKMHRPVSLDLVETNWGYILRSKAKNAGHGSALNAGFRFFGMILVAAAFAHWLVPEGLYRNDPWAAKSAITGLLSAAGAVIYAIGLLVQGYEVQVDTSVREVRLARRRRKDVARVTQSIPFAGVESVFVERHPGKPADLLLRVKGAREPIKLLSGLERELNLLHARLCRDLKSPQERMEMRLSASATPPLRQVRLRHFG